ncbi:MAG: hypothetical protein LBJ94_02490 [Puniceicoccales bacterium]|jgi:hypothetical protein|nr:hypothetical protein [Puniceicoccales bacterium]
MKIFIGDIVLAGGVEAHESPYDVNIRSEREVQVTGTLRGSTARSYDRGNQRTTVNFKVTRRHGSVEDAQKFVLIHGASLGNLSTSLTIVEEPSAVQFILSDAAIVSVQSSANGSASVHEYRIVGGNFSQIQT